MKFVVRMKDRDGFWRYLHTAPGGAHGWLRSPRYANKYDSPQDAALAVMGHGAEVVQFPVTPEESMDPSARR
jgi:hypothetical protein